MTGSFTSSLTGLNHPKMVVIGMIVLTLKSVTPKTQKHDSVRFKPLHRKDWT